MMDRKHIEAIEACRPVRDDLAMPEMEFLAQALQRDSRLQQLANDVATSDQMIAYAMRDVPTPIGLRERIIAAIASDSAAKPAEPEQPFRARKSEYVSRLNRRAWVGVGIGISALAATVMFGLWINGPADAPGIDSEQLLTWIKNGLEDVTLDRGGWRSVQNRAANRYDASSQIRVHPIQWRQLSGNHIAPTQVFSLDQTGTTFLFVMEYDGQTDLPLRPPIRPYPSGDWNCGFWREGSFIYGLVSLGSRAEYENLLKSSPIT